MTLANSTVSDNTTTVLGGGILSEGELLTMVNVTVSGNWARFGGGIGLTEGSLKIENVTVTDNLATEEGGGLFRDKALGAIAFVNSIVAENWAPIGPDCSGSVRSEGSSLLQDESGCDYVTGKGDIVGVDPLLGPLRDNGGPTFTHALWLGSPAIDAGDDSSAPGTDQRGISRPQADASDIGAFELQADAPTQ